MLVPGLTRLHLMPTAGTDQSRGFREERTVVVVNISGFFVFLQAAAELVCASTGNS